MAIVNGQGVHFSGVKKCARPLIDINQAVQVSSLTVEGAFVVHAKVTCPARIQR
jgi:hypothetical protein